jgi:hypothetical protein
LVNRLYALDLEDMSIYNINTKRARLNDLNTDRMIVLWAQQA